MSNFYKAVNKAMIKPICNEHTEESLDSDKAMIKPTYNENTGEYWDSDEDAYNEMSEEFVTNHRTIKNLTPEQLAKDLEEFIDIVGERFPEKRDFYEDQNNWLETLKFEVKCLKKGRVSVEEVLNNI